MIIFPLIAAAVSAAFSTILFLQFSRRRRLPQLAWGAALAMYAIASIALAIGVGSGWNGGAYRIFWLFGAMLNVPWLALGSIALLHRIPAALAFVAVLAGTIFALVKTGDADLDAGRLAGETQIPRGKDVWMDHSIVTFARLYSILAWIVVVLIAVWTARPRQGQRPPRDRVRGNWLIAIGVSIVAIGGFGLSRVGRGSAFAVTLAAGIVVMFFGFLFASRGGRPQMAAD